MSKTALILGRYTLTNGTSGLSGREQSALLEELKFASPVAYRKPDPGPNDFDTYIIGPRAGTRRGEPFLTWQVCRDISFRQVRRPDRRSQVVEFEFEETDDCVLSRIVALPRLGVLAAEDGAGEGKLAGWSAIRRFEAIVRAHSRLEFSAQPAGSPEDLRRAIETWELEKFSFQARPFNPHPSNPGKVLSDMMKADGVGELRGQALPVEGAYIKPKEEGIVQETLGLAEKGYATYGATARTPSGAEAVVKKQQFSHDRHKNLERLRGAQQLRVYVDGTDDEKRIVQAVDVLVEFFAPDAISRT